MKKYTFLFVIAFFISSNLLFSQGPSFYDLTFKADSITKPYVSVTNSRIYIKSKRGSDGMPTSTSADSVKAFVISKIVLVFTESSADDIANREEYNQERWENLIMTYPEFFQTKTVYQNMCQCTSEAGGDEYKSVQGFYVYYVPKGGGATSKVVAPAVVKSDPVVEPAKKAVPAEEPVKNIDPVVTKNETSATVKTEPAVTKTEEPKKEIVKESEPVLKEAEEPVAVNENTTKKKAPAVNKPKRSKDSKACRPACYGGGDEDLKAYFKDHITLTKKQKKKWKSNSTELKIQLNFDGSIKKAMVVGANPELNKLALEAANGMSEWNSSVKNGVAIKSEVRIILKFDKETKSFIPFETIINPRPAPKCKCMSDSDMFGD